MGVRGLVCRLSDRQPVVDPSNRSGSIRVTRVVPGSVRKVLRSAMRNQLDIPVLK